jgi:TolB-like protein/Flp pilus assembly protein TadD
MVVAMGQVPDRFGPFTFDRQRMTVARDGTAHPIGTRGTALLAQLVDANGEVVGKEALLQAAWPGRIVEEANLTVQIAALRKALGAREDGEDWIATVPRVGYRLVAGEEAQPHAARPSIAVLPFANLSSDSEQEYFADGIVEDIITALSRFRTFAVVARNSTFVYKGRAVDIREAAKTLGVRYLLEGSVRRAGDRVRVAAQLIEGATGEHLWAENFDGTVADIFDFQDSITSATVGFIEPQIRKAEIERATRKRPESMDAWDLYVQALPLVHSSKVSDYTKAIELIDRAVAIDPNYAPALALAAWAHEKRYTFGGPALPDHASDLSVCLSLAERAVEADPDDALALVQLGWMRIYLREDPKGIELVRRALALNPNNVSVLDFAAVALIFTGDLDDVIATATKALHLSPGSPNNYALLSHISNAHNAAGRFEQAVEFGERAVELAPGFVYGHMHLGVSYAHLGRIEEARREIAIVSKLRPDITIATESDSSMMWFPERRASFLDGLRKAGLREV